MRILITGANGNLGGKLVEHFVNASWCSKVIALDRPGNSAMTRRIRCEAIGCDLRAPSSEALDAIASADAIVHLAAQNPYPDASWSDASASFDMTANLLGANRAAKRFVFASSNHVMGGYKDVIPSLTAGSLTTSLPPWPGTRFVSGGITATSTPYAVAKLMGERLCESTARSTQLTTVALRIGWCQPGENLASTISVSGTPKDGTAFYGPEATADQTWFRNMWLTNRDLIGIVEGAIHSDASRWPKPAIVVNAMSNNTGMSWDIEPVRDLLSYQPQDDIWKNLKHDP